MDKPKSSFSYLTSFLLFLAAVGGIAPVTSLATDASVGYQYDMNGKVVRDANGDCLRTSKWSPAVAIEECDPGIVADREDMSPVREEKAVVSGVSTRVNLLVMQAGDAFAFNSAELSEAGKQQLAGAMGMYQDAYIYRVYIDGYTDKIGDDDYNLELSRQRAEAVQAELEVLGLPKERTRVFAHGSAEPLVTCPDLAGEELIRCLAPNRRTEIRFVVPVISTATAAEFVERRRSEEIKVKNIAAEGVLLDTPIINRGINAAVRIVGDGCSKEINTFCADVLIGQNRMMNCLAHHEDQLSDDCVAAIAKGKSTVSAALGDANFFGAKCGPDIKFLCPDVAPGEGRTLACLVEHNTNITKRCYDALIELNLIHN
ncbi:MAG TPA: OmpA family protein [Gammaproteobacteria bacterium]|nr:OmpA family protein [Gammaproteobacteria bacterium]